MYSICLRIIGDVDRAADAAQETFVRAWERSAQFKPGTSYGAWIAAIAGTVALNEVRSNSRKRISRGHEAERLDMLPAPSRSPDDGMALEDGIARLSPSTRAVFVLHDVHGYSSEEIASMMDIESVTVRVHVHKARRFLRGWLGA